MKLPNGETAYIPPSKLKAYLISETHPIGKSKAKLLRSAGFNEDNVSRLKEGLLAIAQSEEVKDVIESAYGVKYIIEGRIKTPSRGDIGVRTVWIVDKGRERPRFVTAYPA